MKMKLTLLILMMVVAIWAGPAVAGVGWIYGQYDATDASLAAYNAGLLTLSTFPTETVYIGGGTMPVLAQSPLTGDLYCHMMGGPLYRSADGGSSWNYVTNTPGTLNEAFGFTSNGTMLLASTWPFPGADRMTTMRIFRSTDGGLSWDDGPNLEFDGFFLPNGDEPVGDFFGPGGYSAAPLNLVSAYGRITELSDGTVVLPFYIEGNGIRPDNGLPYDTWALLARSHDGGQTWGDFSTITKDFNENGLLETPSGELLSVLRGQDNVAVGFARSQDGGYTWSTAQNISVTPGMLEHASDIVRLSDGTLVVPTIRRTFAGQGVPVTVSYDNGATWSEDYRIGLRVDNGPGGFPSSVVLDDDTIVTVDGGSSGNVFATRWQLPAEMRPLQEKGTLPVPPPPPPSAMLWSDGFEDGGSGSVNISVAFPGVWSGSSPTDDQPRLLNESFAVRPEGMTSTTRAPNGPTSGEWVSTRYLGTDYTTGVVSVEGWLDSRSSDGATSNYAGIGLSETDLTGLMTPELMLYYHWNTDAIELRVNGALVRLSDAYGTGDMSPTYSNTDLTLYNQWQHVWLQVDLDAQIAWFYLDSDQSTGGGPWTLLGTYDISGAGIDSLGYAALIVARDGNVDDMITYWTPEPATLGMLLASGLALLRRRK